MPPTCRTGYAISDRRSRANGAGNGCRRNGQSRPSARRGPPIAASGHGRPQDGRQAAKRAAHPGSRPIGRSARQASGRGGRLTSGEQAADWARKAFAAKNSLTAADARPSRRRSSAAANCPQSRSELSRSSAIEAMAQQQPVSRGRGAVVTAGRAPSRAAQVEPRPAGASEQSSWPLPRDDRSAAASTRACSRSPSPSATATRSTCGSSPSSPA